MQKTKANHSPTIDLPILLKRPPPPSDVIRSVFLILHPTNPIQPQPPCQTIRSTRIHMRSCHRYRTLSIHHRNRITVVAARLEDTDIAFEPSDAFGTRPGKAVNAVCPIIQK